METVDLEMLQTETQLNRSRRNRDILCEVERLRKEYPDVKINRIFEAVGKQFYITGRRVSQLWYDYTLAEEYPKGGER